MKSHTTITIDTFIRQQAKKNFINISQTAEEALKAKLAIITGDTSNLNKRLLEMEINEKQDQISKDSVELKQLQEDLENIIRIEKEVEKEDLKRDKEEIEKKIRCIECENVSDGKMHQFPLGIVCHACFLSSEGKTKKWMKE